MKSLLFGPILVLTAIAVAQVPGGGDPSDDDYNNWEFSRNQMAVASVTGLTLNQWVSGTKVEFTVSTSVAERPMGPTWTPDADNDWSMGRGIVSAVSLKIGGETVTLPPVPSEEDSYSKNIRFASTHFNDGSDINLELTTTVVYRRFEGQTLAASETKTFTKLVKVKAYNRLEIMATKLSVPPTLSKSIAQAAGFAFHDSHTITPSILEDPWRTKAQLAQDLRHSTFTFFSTHANMNLYEDSDGGSPPTRVTYGENNGYLFDNRATGVPSMNIAVMYSCATLNATSFPWPISFGVSGALGMIGNKAYAGFTDELPNAWEGPMGEVSLYSHANYFITKLQEGSTVGAAATEANETFEPPTGLQIRGDSYARIINVYLNATERDGLSQEEINKWYRVF